MRYGARDSIYTIYTIVGAMQEEDCPRCKKHLNRLTKLRNWRDEAMTGAIEAVKGVNYAVAKFGVPASMLRDSLSVELLTGPKPHLSSQEEGKLTAYLTSSLPHTTPSRLSKYPKVKRYDSPYVLG